MIQKMMAFRSDIRPGHCPAALLALTGCCCFGLAGTLLAESEVHEDSLGQKYVDVPGTVVKFAVTETTVGSYREFVQSSGYEWNFRPHFDQSSDHPVVGVNLQDALAFCNWLTEREREQKRIGPGQVYRLPSEQEWGAAAGLEQLRNQGEPEADVRLADQRRFPWGLSWPPPANAANLAEQEIADFSDPHPYTAPVGKTLPSADGIYDLAGNVWEWTSDGDLLQSAQAALRGGSWAYFNPDTLRSAYIYRLPATQRAATIGFRVVFGDRERSAAWLAAAGSVGTPTLDEQKRKLAMAAEGEVSAEELESLRKRVAEAGAGTQSGSSIPADPGKLEPWQAGSSFLNSLGVKMLPLPGTAVSLAETEVTAGQYELFLQSLGADWPEKPAHTLSTEHVAAALPWARAVAFCEWLTSRERELKLIPETLRYRLPKDQEWSLAAGLEEEGAEDPAGRHDESLAHYPWEPSDAWPPPPRSANVDASKLAGYDDSYPYTAPVKAHKANKLGFHELGGNVAEWCQDPWPGEENARTVRGGSWLSASPKSLRSAVRQKVAADAIRENIGFRVALEDVSQD
jgi:formylglycine-generating enzyme required for sulfatase activity